MADVTPPYVPVTGDVFNPDQWNRNLDSTAGGESLYGELNGRLTDANFTGAARIRPEHPKPLETFRWRADWLTGTLDYFQDTFERGTSQDNDAPSGGGTDPFIPIAGASTRIYLPYNCSVVMYQVSAFYSVFQMRERAEGSNAETRTGPVSQLKMYIDGTGLLYTQRRTPRTYWPIRIATAVVGSPPPTERESVLTQHFDIAHIATSTGSDSARTQAGWHQVDLRLFVAPTIGFEEFLAPFKPLNVDNIYYPLSHRVRVGVRSARILALL